MLYSLRSDFKEQFVLWGHIEFDQTVVHLGVFDGLGIFVFLFLFDGIHLFGFSLFLLFPLWAFFDAAPAVIDTTQSRAHNVIAIPLNLILLFIMCS